MIDIYEKLKNNKDFRKVSAGELLLVEFISINDDSLKDVWSEYNCLAYVMEGQKTWITRDERYVGGKGDILFCQRGGQIAYNCRHGVRLLAFFFPDSFVEKVLLEFPAFKDMGLSIDDPSAFKILKLQSDKSTQIMFQSVENYFFEEQYQSEELLTLKFKELILHLLTNRRHAMLASYLSSILRRKHLCLADVMNSNFLYNLGLDQYARLANCSLSTFKRNFVDLYGMPPGKWLLQKRLEHSMKRILTTDENINEIAFISGFENTSHFVKAFKKEFGDTPNSFRRKMQPAVAA
jgi:AraC family transcriptional regulator, exoenzyme S synthesis regulatory protein ExsA